MVDHGKHRHSEWERLFAIACDIVDQVQEQTGG
jgi:hypothetical protein